jgi:hypothetical protein
MDSASSLNYKHSYRCIRSFKTGLKNLPLHTILSQLNITISLISNLLSCSSFVPLTTYSIFRTNYVYEFSVLYPMWDRLCGLVVRFLAHRSRGLGSISGATRFFWEVLGLERGPLSLISTSEELLGRKNSDPCLENRKYGSRYPSRSSHGTLYPQTLALISSRSGGVSVGIVSSRSLAEDLFLYFVWSPFSHILAACKVLAPWRHYSNKPIVSEIATST